MTRNSGISYHDHAQFTLWKIRQFDLLDCNSFPSIPIQRSIHGTESSLSQTVAQLLKGSASAQRIFCGEAGAPCSYIVLELCNVFRRRLYHFIILRFLFSLRRTRSDSCQSWLYRGPGGSRGGGERTELSIPPIAGPSDHIAAD